MYPDGEGRPDLRQAHRQGRDEVMGTPLPLITTGGRLAFQGGHVVLLAG